MVVRLPLHRRFTLACFLHRVVVKWRKKTVSSSQVSKAPFNMVRLEIYNLLSKPFPSVGIFAPIGTFHWPNLLLRRFWGPCQQTIPYYSWEGVCHFAGDHRVAPRDTFITNRVTLWAFS